MTTKKFAALCRYQNLTYKNNLLLYYTRQEILDKKLADRAKKKKHKTIAETRKRKQKSRNIELRRE